MSLVRDKFFELLTPKLQELGYEYSKSKFSYKMTIKDQDYIIDFSWDGRGGTSIIRSIEGKVSYATLRKIDKAMDIWSDGLIWQINCGNFDSRIPVMYSKELLDLANDMAFKKMSEMPFEKKYPIELIEKCVDTVYEIITTETIHKLMQANEKEIIALRTQELIAELEAEHYDNCISRALCIKVWCKYFGLPEPSFITALSIFNNNTLDVHWNNTERDYNKMIKIFDDIKPWQEF
jgi:hypothetical protein